VDFKDLGRTHAEQLAWPDDDVVRWAAGIISVPKREPADSFVLHAPLELMARTALLELLDEDDRADARARIIHLAVQYADAGEPVEPPAPVSPRSNEQAVTTLLGAISSSDLGEIDRWARWLGENLDHSSIEQSLGSRLVSSLAAAAHATIGLELFGRSGAISGAILRGALREVGRHPDWHVEIHDVVDGDRPLVDALVEVPYLGAPDSDFIRPMVMHGSQIARRLLANASADPVEATRALSRVAAWSMLQESDRYTPYGWTHALTIPQSVMSIDVDPSIAVAVAASQLVGFRASMGTVTLSPTVPFPAASELDWRRLSASASSHHDAHFVKYTLACRDAADADPEESGLYQAAARRLNEFWRERASGEPAKS